MDTAHSEFIDGNTKLLYYDSWDNNDLIRSRDLKAQFANDSSTCMEQLALTTLAFRFRTCSLFCFFVAVLTNTESIENKVTNLAFGLS